MIDHASLGNINHYWPSSGVYACSNVSLSLQSGTLHALVGENGAGKTTLGLIFSGILKPDSGILRLGSKEVNLKEKPRGIIPEIALIRQRNIWPGVLTVREAAILGRGNIPGTIKEQNALFNKTAEEWQLSGINPNMKVSAMDAASLQRAEMIAALMFNPQILILDEPSSAWEEGRGGEFFQLIDKLKKSGRSILLITHRLEDVFSIAERVTVMRHGRKVSSRNIDETDYSRVTLEMFGEETVHREETQNSSRPKQASPDSPRLQAMELGVNDSGIRALKGVSFTLYPGEILGITGLREEGLSFLEDVISGNRKLDSGKILLDGRPYPSNASKLRKAGLHYVPSDKTGRGSSLKSTLTENLMVLESRSLSRKGWFLREKIDKWIENHRGEGGISGNPDQKLEELSGGNIQKVILQRELNRESRLLVIADPTWGLDEKSRRNIHRRIREIRDRGTAVLFLASDLDEALELSDNLAILSGGELSRIKPASSWERREAAELIAGMKELKAQK